MQELTFEQAWGLLYSSATTLRNHVDESLVPIKNAMNPATKLPEGCPSPASLALMVFKDIKHDLDEISNAVRLVEQAIARGQ